MTAIVSAARRGSHANQRSDLREAAVKLELARKSAEGKSTAAVRYISEAQAYVANSLRLLATEPNPGAADYRHERLAPPSRFDPRSFRTLERHGHRIIVGCPLGHWHPGRPAGEQCDAPMTVQAVLHPTGERNCPNPTLAIVGNPGQAPARHPRYAGELFGVAVHRIDYDHVRQGPRFHDFERPEHVYLYRLNDDEVLITGEPGR